MKMRNVILALAGGCLCLTSCQKEESASVEDVVFVSNNHVVVDYNDVLQFTYDGVVYSSPCYETEDSLVVEDEKVAEVYNYLMELPFDCLF